MHPDTGQNSSAQPTQSAHLRRRGKTLLTSFLILAILAGATFSITNVLSQHHAAHADAPALVGDASTYQSDAQPSFYVAPPQRSTVKSPFKSFAVSSVPAFNNVGISTKGQTAAANIDGGGYSYSFESLLAADIGPGLPFTYDGMQLTWPNVDNQTNPTQADNWQAAGQVLPLQPADDSQQVIGFVGAATGGAVRGNGTVTYSDGSTFTIPLGFSDWTLGGGKNSPTYGNRIVSATTARDGKAGVQNVKTYLFYASFTLATGKTPISVKLPTLSGADQLHVFAYGLRGSFDPNSDPYNSIGTSDDAYPSAGNFDGSGYSYSAAAMPWGTDDTIAYNSNLAGAYNMKFLWPDVLPGSPDNYLANGQVVPVTPVAHATTLGFVGAATNGPSYGTAFINYTDGSLQTFKLGFSDWTLHGYTQPPSFDNRFFAGMPYRNTRTGQQNLSAFLFYTEANIDPNKTVLSVTLPSSISQGQIHVYTIATGQAGFYDSVGVTDDKAPVFGDLDGANHSYSTEALQSAGIFLSTPTSIHPFTVNSTSFTIMDGGNAIPDNWVPDGQVIPVTPVVNATALAFLGSATNGKSAGWAIITYSDGTTETPTFGFSDWCANTEGSNNYLAATMAYRNSPYGPQTTKNYLYYTEVPLLAGKTVTSVQLPESTTGGTMHIFAVAEHAGNYNNVGITNDTATSVGGFDANHANSYSAQAMQSAGLVSGHNFSFNGYSFPWPTAGVPDNYYMANQLINTTPPAGTTKIAFLGSAINGGATGSITINYAGSSQTINLTFSDWCKDTSGTVAATMSYRNTHTGQQKINTYVYFAEFTLNAPDIQNIRLSGDSNLHVFSYAFK